MAKINLITDVGSYELEADLFKGFLRNSLDGACAFCAGDPFNIKPEQAPKHSQIAQFKKDYKQVYFFQRFLWDRIPVRACPVCEGKPN